MSPEKKARYSRIRSCDGLIAGVDALDKRNIIARDKNRTYSPLRDDNNDIKKGLRDKLYIYRLKRMYRKSSWDSSLYYLSHNSRIAESVFTKFVVGKIY